jgi:hypothetical protein
MSEKGKRGSSRRKGDVYQDLTALRFAVERYIDRKPFEMYLEYEKSGNLDDVVIFEESELLAYQVKWAANRYDNYTLDDFFAPDGRASMGRFAESWQRMRQRYPNQKLTACLCSDRGLDSSVARLVDDHGAFLPEVIENRKRKDDRETRSKLADASKLDDETFAAFLKGFRFVLQQPTLDELEQFIRTVLLGSGLGISDDSIFSDLRVAVEKHALFSRDAITLDWIDSLLERVQSKLLIPQVFQVNSEHFIEQKSLSEQLDRVLPQINGGYLIVTGLPGSGKSTSLTKYFDCLDRREYEIFRYYCFVSVNDNAQRMRIQAESLRSNLLDEFHRRYPSVLKRRFDHSERNFIECLESLARYFVGKGRRLVIFLDGLDHAERLDSEQRETVISALPSDVPDGVTVVVGTQELHKWPSFLKRARETPDSHIRMPLFSQAEVRAYLEDKRGVSGLSHADVAEIFRKCEGLPLYLWYVAEILISSDSPREALASLEPAAGGNIRDYYGLLWEEFDRVGMGNPRHLCVVMACLRFSVLRDELFRIQEALRRPDFEDAFKSMSHLLRETEDRLTVFHNSFREFVVDQIPGDWSREVNGQIASWLRGNRDSPRWFGNVFEYSYEAGDYTYVLNEVNAEYVDRALMHCRPSVEILDAIDWGIESAFKSQDIVQLSRLGSLKYRTGERLEHNLDHVILGKALLALGREQDVMSFAFSQENGSWLVDKRTALSLMSRLAEEGKWELGKRLFDIFMDEFRGVNADSENELMFHDEVKAPTA